MCEIFTRQRNGAEFKITEVALFKKKKNVTRIVQLTQSLNNALKNHRYCSSVSVSKQSGIQRNM
jgi:hypothetical protein